MAFKLTYATMSNPPQEMHDKFDQALENAKQTLGREYPMIINGEKRFAEGKHHAFSPINTSLHLATFQKGTAKDADDAIAAAKAAFPNWKAMNWEERVYLMRKFADTTGLNLGAPMEEAIARMERGEDPEQIEQEMGDLMAGEEPFSLEAIKKKVAGGLRRPPLHDERLYEL